MMVQLKLLFLSTIFLIANSLLAFENLSIDDQNWITQNLKKPEVELEFILFVNNFQLDPQKLSKDSETTLLLKQAKKDLLSAQLNKARKAIDKAYAAHPESADVYQTELMYQFYSALIQYSQSNKYQKPSVLPLSYAFFKKAQINHGQLETPHFYYHALKVMQIFYSSLLSHIDQFKKRQAFDFIITPELTSDVSRSRNYFIERKNSKERVNYFSKLCLLMLAIVENKDAEVEQYFQALVQMSEANNDLYRLMTIYAMANTDAIRAKTYMNKSIQLADNRSDRQFLAGLYAQSGDYDEAIDVLRTYQGKQTVRFLIHLIGYFLLNTDLDEAEAYYQQLKLNPDSKLNKDFNYYSLVIELLNTNYTAVELLLDQLKSSKELYESAEHFIKRFKHDSNGDNHAN
jgi:hypothetical protein